MQFQESLSGGRFGVQKVKSNFVNLFSDALVVTLAMLMRLINCRFIIIIFFKSSVDMFPREFKN